MMERSEDYVLIGKVGKPHGVKGEIRITPFSGDTEKLAGYSTLLLAPDKIDGKKRKYKLLKGYSQGDCAVISLLGIDNRNDAEQVRDYNIWLAREDLPELSDSEFYWHDFEGKEVYTRQGAYLGRVRNLISNGFHDTLVISGESRREYMIPVCSGFVQGPDDKKDMIVVSPPEGLLDINE
ncbi:MAG: ribosome maturation factor RimM [Thermodesulfobacteriota bacterium]